ncbi:diverse immunoglobulin domain-containing protein 2.2 [Pseudorasbora parva]|uniref:diverse immunoglobulin domain-containing protein 2.2 n=1 Tax=Pseudorasbora parva TaxID=51549 RepID=UPI00351DE0EE
MGLGTAHPQEQEYDLDSTAWPHTPRERPLEQTYRQLLHLVRLQAPGRSWAQVLDMALAWLTLGSQCDLESTSGQTDIHRFISDGGNVSLPCYGAPPRCNPSKWLYRRERSSNPIVLSENGMKKNDTEIRERLSLVSDCSLNIYKATTEDRGHYICRHFDDPQFDTSVYLHVLHVSPSSTQTESRPGSSFSLSCQLYVYNGWSCDDLFFGERVQLVWVNTTGVNLQSDSRFQISSSPEHCNISLTTTLLKEDDNTEWRCQITKGTEVQTSAGYTVTLPSTPAAETTQVIPVAVAVAALLILIALIALWLICKKRARADNEAVSTLTPVTPPAADVHGKKEDVAYAEVIICRKKFTETHNVQANEVTYAAIRGPKAGPRDEGLF